MDSSLFEDFKREITDNDYDVNDFQLNHTDLTNWNSGLALDQGSATIRRKSTGKEKSYNASSGTRWVVDFSNDLKSGFFN